MKFLFKGLTVLVLITVNIFIWYKVFDSGGKNPQVLSVVATPEPAISSASGQIPTEALPSSAPSQQPEAKVQTTSKGLEQAVKKALEGTGGRYSVGIKNLKTGETYFFDEDRQYEAGSLYKLWVMATAFDKIQKGELKEEDEMSRTIVFLNQAFGIDPSSAELTSGGITMTVSVALEQMITISHNYAALLLTERLKLSQVKAYLESLNLPKSKVGSDTDPPYTTASDMVMFMEKLYKGELANSENSTKMVELLKRQKLNKKLPKYLPKNTVIGHKTGEIGWFSHDAGIVFSEKGDYIIAVLTETSSPPGAEDRIAQVSKGVFEYFNK